MRLKTLGVFVVAALAMFTVFYWITDEPRRGVIGEEREGGLVEYGMELFGPDTVESQVTLTGEGFDPAEIELPVNGTIKFVNGTDQDRVVSSSAGAQAFQLPVKAGSDATRQFTGEGEFEVVSDAGGALRVTVGPERLNPAAANCARCHGPDGTGGGADAPAPGPNLHSRSIAEKLRTNDNYVSLVIRFGGVVVSGNVGSLMPAWSTEVGGPLNATQIEALEALVRSWAEEAAAQPTGTPVPNTPEAGREVFLSAAPAACSNCHGQDLAGVEGQFPNLQTIGIEPVIDLPTPISQLDKLQTDYAADPAAFLGAWIRDSSTNYNDGQPTLMPAYPPEQLPEDQLQALITYLLTQGR